MSPELVRLVTEYFQSDGQPSRDALVPRIEQESGGSIAAVAEAVASARLWPDPIPETGVVSVQLAGARVPVSYRVPQGYDPRTGHPLVLCMPSRSVDPLEQARAMLGAAVEGFVVASPASAIGGSVHYENSGAADLAALLRELRRTFHINSARMYVFGVDGGADAAWMAAVSHAHLLAGVIAVEGYPRVPFPDQVYPFLLGNLARLPVLSVHTACSDESSPRRCRAVARHNEFIIALAERAHWPIARVVSDRAPAGPFVPPPDATAALLGGVKGPPPKQTSHWFRYSEEGQSDWLTQLRFRGEVWDDSQLSILPAGGTPRDAYIAKVVQEHLAYLGGRVEGQTITVETRRCAEIELSLPVSLVDLERPVTIRINGKRRLKGMIRPSIKTMLETAFERWEFQRPVVARLRFTIPRDALNPD